MHCLAFRVPLMTDLRKEKFYEFLPGDEFIDHAVGLFYPEADTAIHADQLSDHDVLFRRTYEKLRFCHSVIPPFHTSDVCYLILAENGHKNSAGRIVFYPRSVFLWHLGQTIPCLVKQSAAVLLMYCEVS